MVFPIGKAVTILATSTNCGALSCIALSNTESKHPWQLHVKETNSSFWTNVVCFPIRNHSSRSFQVQRSHCLIHNETSILFSKGTCSSESPRPIHLRRRHRNDPQVRVINFRYSSRWKVATRHGLGVWKERR